MSTSYEIRCPDHADSWPEDGGASYHIPAFWQLIERRRGVAAVAAIPDLDMSMMGCYDELSLGEFFTRHADCPNLSVFNEYGEKQEP